MAAASAWPARAPQSRQADAGGPVVISPWPFREPELVVSVEASMLTQLQFRDDAALTAGLCAAPIETLRWTLGRADG